jgi:stress-induced morphogen
MPATVTVEYQGDVAIEKQIQERLEQALKEYDSGLHVSVSGSAWQDILEIKVSSGEQVDGVKRLDRHRTVDKIVEEACHMVKVSTANERKRAS